MKAAPDDSNTVKVRIQLSLYVPEPQASAIDAVRRLLDPVQHSLIPAHVTLCREDEMAEAGRDVLASRIASLPVQSVTLRFGRPEPFHEHGILLPCIEGEPQFQALRQLILNPAAARRQSPHITLAHPRNPKAAGNCLGNALAIPEGLTATFFNVRLIEQTGSSAWRTLEDFALGGTRTDRGNGKGRIR